MLARFAHVESCESEAGREAIEIFWEKAVESRAEGLMIKVCFLYAWMALPITINSDTGQSNTLWCH
jgi:hypothetical protein